MKLMIIMNVRKLYTCMSAAITSWITLVWSNYLKMLGTKRLELLKHFQFHTSQHGLILIPNFRAWADTFWGIWGIFGQLISTHFGTVSPLSMFFINQPLFLKKKSQIFIWNLGFEFGPQRFRGLAIVCPCLKKSAFHTIELLKRCTLVKNRENQSTQVHICCERELGYKEAH